MTCGVCLYGKSQDCQSVKRKLNLLQDMSGCHFHFKTRQSGTRLCIVQHFHGLLLSVAGGVLKTVPCCQRGDEKLKITLQPGTVGISRVWSCHWKDLKDEQGVDVLTKMVAF